jgi:hypothetical protein
MMQVLFFVSRVDSEIWTNLGLTHEALLQYDEALAVYKAALARFGDDESELYSRLCELRTRQYLVRDIGLVWLLGCYYYCSYSSCCCSSNSSCCCYCW